MIRLYHTSNVEVRTPDVAHSREHLDFGRGFYLTSLREQAEKYGLRFLRKGDFDTIDLYFSGVYTYEQALDQLRFKHPNHQVCITNQFVLDKHLHFIESIKL